MGNRSCGGGAAEVEGEVAKAEGEGGRGGGMYRSGGEGGGRERWRGRDVRIWLQ